MRTRKGEMSSGRRRKRGETSGRRKDETRMRPRGETTRATIRTQGGYSNTTGAIQTRRGDSNKTGAIRIRRRFELNRGK